MVSAPPDPAAVPDNRLVVVDACTWQNFAVVDGLWVLKARYAEVGFWTEAIRNELQRGLPAEPKLQEVLDLENDWLGGPVRLEGESLGQVDLIRRGLGGVASAPLQHLGEAEAIHFLEQATGRRRIFITDDGPAADFAGRRPSGIQVLDAAAVLADAFAMGEIGCPGVPTTCCRQCGITREKFGSLPIAKCADWALRNVATASRLFAIFARAG